jgi:hypothetical protein
MATTLRILHPQWRDEFESTPYPFGDWATLRNDGETFIPEGTFLDASLYPADSGIQLRISQIIVSNQTITIHIGDETSDSIATGVLDVLEEVNEIRLGDAFGRPAGILVSTAEKLLIFQTWPLGTHAFSFPQTGFSSAVHLPVSSNYFRGFILDDGSIVAGDIWLVGEGGIILSYGASPQSGACEPGSDALPDEQSIKVHITGDPLSDKNLCDSSFVSPNLLKTLTFRRGCDSVITTPDDTGDIKITAGLASGESTVLRINTIGGKLVIEAAGSQINE